MSNLIRVVPLPVIPHPRVPSSTSSATICGRYHELLPMIVATPACMPQFYTSQVWGIVRGSKVIASLSHQTSSRSLLMKHLGTHDPQPQTVRVSASYFHSSLGVTS
jgi:hypothetical protein